MDKIAVLDFGGQYCHLISRRIRDFGVLAEVLPSDIPASKLKKDPGIKGLILSGGARSVYEPNPPKFDKEILALGLPILGICYGHQLVAHVLGGRVVSGKAGEYGLTELKVLPPLRPPLKGGETGGVLKGLPRKSHVWMNHRDVVVKMPAGFEVLAKTAHSAIAAYANEKLKIFCVQFHPEVTHTQIGTEVLRNFVFGICKSRKYHSEKQLAQVIVDEARTILGKNRAIIGLSGGVDSSVAAMLVSKAIGKRLLAVYVDTGLMREGETDFIRKTFAKKGLNLKVVHAGKKFFKGLKGITDPETKRKVIGKLFVDVFHAAAKKFRADFLIQGTIYSDRIESGLTKHSSVIKSHHNVGGLPKNLKLKLYEPLRDLYKDEVRQIAREIGLPKEIAARQVFPGPGLAIRILGEVNPFTSDIVRRAHTIIEEELRHSKFWPQIYMSFAVLLPVKSVGIQGDERTYKYPIVLRIIESKDVMTSNFSKLPYGILEKISTRITNEIREVNRVVYDITNKPPATMEWE